MVSDSLQSSYDLAVRDFKRARREAAIRRVLTTLRGETDDLLDYEAISKEIATDESVDRGLKEIDLDKIVGSVGRYQDFTKTFLPKHNSDQDRWAGVMSRITDMKGMPPIELYQIGDAYFVKDGNHRVSVARQLGNKTISAYVTEVKTKAKVSAEMPADQIILNARLARFIETTGLDESDFTMTIAGHYNVLLRQIDREWQQLQQTDPAVSYQKAVTHWHDTSYLPVLHALRDLGTMRRFPNRTAADIYILITEKREQLEEALGWRLDPEASITSIIGEENQVGEWRKRQQTLNRHNHLFENILVMLEGIPEDADLLNQVIQFSQTDHDHILGLFVNNKNSDPQPVQTLFETKIAGSTLQGDFAIYNQGLTNGDFAQAVLDRAPYADLVVVNLTSPPISTPLGRLRSDWGNMIENCPRPILAIPHAIGSPQDNVLLSYDGSRKADEALYVAAYLTSKWHKTLTVLTVNTPNTPTTALDKAKTYLTQRGITNATYLLRKPPKTGFRPLADTILETASEVGSNMLIMGGFGYRPARRLMLGSTVEHMLQDFPHPMLICR